MVPGWHKGRSTTKYPAGLNNSAASSLANGNQGDGMSVGTHDIADAVKCDELAPVKCSFWQRNHDVIQVAITVTIKR